MTSTTRLQAAEVKALYARFRRLAPSGYLLQQQFQQTMGVMGLTDDHFLVDRMFQVFDTDHDGKLSFIEFASALAIMIRGTEDEKLAFSFKIVGGKEASGVRLEDFQQLVASYNRMMSSLVAPTGRLTSDEDVKRLFHELASTRDETEEEVISLDAYKAAAQENGDFLSCLGLEPMGGRAVAKKPQKPAPVPEAQDLDAPASAVESAFRRRSLDCHPDKRPGDPTAKAKFEALAAAKETLLDPDKRAAAISEVKLSQGQAFLRPRRAAGPPRAGAAAKKPAAPPAAAKPDPPAKSGFVPPSQREEPTPRASVPDPEKAAAGIFFRHLERQREKKEPRRDFLLPHGPFLKTVGEARATKKRPVQRAARESAPKDRSGLRDGAGISGKVKRLAEAVHVQPAPPWVGGGEGAQSHRVPVIAPTQEVPEPAPSPPECRKDDATSTPTCPRAAPAPQGKKKKDIPAARCLPLPLLLPATADIGALTTAVGRATGAKASDAGVLARVVSVLRRSGGEASLASLTQNPKRLKRILSRYPRLIDVYFPGKFNATQTLEVHARLRGAELQRAKEEEQERLRKSERWQTMEAEPINPFAPSAGRFQPGARLALKMRLARTRPLGQPVRRTGKKQPRVVDVDSSDEGSCLVMPPPPPSAQPGSRPGSGGEQQDTGLTCAEANASDNALLHAYAHAVGKWKASIDSVGSAVRRYFLLLPAGGLGLLRPGHPSLLYSFDVASKVLYEYVPAEERCVVMWSPSCPEVNAALWTVLPLPPEAPAQEAPSTPEAPPEEEEDSDSDDVDIDRLICDAAAEAGVQLNGEPCSESASFDVENDSRWLLSRGVFVVTVFTPPSKKWQVSAGLVACGRKSFLGRLPADPPSPVPEEPAQEDSYPWWMPTCGCTPMTRLTQLPCEARGEILDCEPAAPTAAMAATSEAHTGLADFSDAQEDLYHEVNALMRLCAKWTDSDRGLHVESVAPDPFMPQVLQEELRTYSRQRHFSRDVSRESEDSRAFANQMPQSPQKTSKKSAGVHVAVTAASRESDGQGPAIQGGRHRALSVSSSRQRRHHRLLGPKKGLAVHFGHENWNMVLSMMIGIRMSVGRSGQELHRELQPVDFIMK
ncbi:ncsA, partial [Symbiodinium necroappetens]